MKMSTWAHLCLKLSLQGSDEEEVNARQLVEESDMLAYALQSPEVFHWGKLGGRCTMVIYFMLITGWRDKVFGAYLCTWGCALTHSLTYDELRNAKRELLLPAAFQCHIQRK